MRIDRLDHLVLTVADLDATVAFYTRVLGLTAVTFGAGRTALTFGTSKINLHVAGHEFEPKAQRPTPGSADLCLIVDGPLARVAEELAAHGVVLLDHQAMRPGSRKIHHELPQARPTCLPLVAWRCLVDLDAHAGRAQRLQDLAAAGVTLLGEVQVGLPS